MCIFKAWRPYNNCHQECLIDLTNVQTLSTTTTVKQHKFDVFLGGSIHTKTKWLESLAVPQLKQNNLTFYQPVIENSIIRYNYNNINNNQTNRMDLIQNEILQWKNIIEQCNVLLFVITNDTCSMTTMIMAAHYIGLNRNVVLCVQHLSEDVEINNEVVCFFFYKKK